jgi:selenocysteine lyase/cysteine desulfurase
VSAPVAVRPTTDEELIARRADFPALDQFVWLQNGGVSLVPRPVHAVHVGLLDEAFRRGPLHIAYPDEEYPRRDASRARIARFVGAEPSEIAVVRGVSEAFQHVIRGIDWQPGDELVITADEEGALLVPALQLARERGVVVRRIPLDETSPQALVGTTIALLSGRTRLLAVSHVTTDWGVRLPVAQICAAVEARGVPTFVDTAHSAGVLPVDLHGIGCSYAGILSYKWTLAPYAAGAFYVRADRLPSLPVVFAGGRAEAILDMAAGTMELYEDARRFEYGPWSWPLVHAWAAALDYVEAIGLDAVERRTTALTNRMKAGLAAIPGVTLHTPRSDRESAALVAFGVSAWSGPALESALRDRFAIRVRALANTRVGVRASSAFFTLESEVDGLIDAVRALAGEPAEDG